jgi:basic amino acid/polyamine antiporter, APA family
MTAIVGAIATGAAFASVVALHTEARYVGTGWMVAGMAGYLLYRHRRGLDPRSQYRIERPQRPLGFYGVAYHSALVPIFDADVNSEAMARAAKLVGPDAEVEALYVLKVPRELELEQGLEEEEERGRNVLEVARLQARARHLKVRVRLIRSRNPGRSIVREAIERHSDLIYLSTEHAPSEERLLGPTTRYVLANRPCRVIVEGGEGSEHPGAGANGRPPRAAARHTGADERTASPA